MDTTSEKSEGKFWDLLLEDDFEEMMGLLTREAPRLVIGAPPCNSFGPLVKSKKEIQKDIKDETECMMRHVKVYTKQLELGGHFLHEHPAESATWKLDEVKKLMEDPRVKVLQGPMCHWSLARGGDLKQRTRWLTSSVEIARVLAGSSAGAGGGQRVEWRRQLRTIHKGPRTALAVKLTPRMVGSVLNALVKRLSADGIEMHSFAAGPHNDGPELIEEHPEYEEKYIDDMSGKPLNTEDVKKGRQEEMQWIAKREVALAEQRKLYDMKWIDTQKETR